MREIDFEKPLVEWGACRYTTRTADYNERHMRYAGITTLVFCNKLMRMEP